MNHHERERERREAAVSETFGIVLLVLVSIILGAVIGSALFDMSRRMEGSEPVALNVQRTAEGIVVTNTGSYAQQIEFITCYTINATGSDYRHLPSRAGSSVLLPNADEPGATRVLVVATNTDGSEHLLLDTHA